jgi:1,2-diacylglycerol 3-beta-glucosyltransferase
VYEEGATKFNTIIKQRKRWAEGSIRRYLDYSDQILNTQNVSPRVLLDMIAYFSEFVLPIWLVSDIFIQAISLLFIKNNLIIPNLTVLSLITLFFITMVFSSIKKFENYKLSTNLIYSTLTAFFLIILWTIVVGNVVIKILFTKRTMKWYKTERSKEINL